MACWNVFASLFRQNQIIRHICQFALVISQSCNSSNQRVGHCLFVVQINKLNISIKFKSYNSAGGSPWAKIHRNCFSSYQEIRGICFTEFSNAKPFQKATCKRKLKYANSTPKAEFTLPEGFESTQLIVSPSVLFLSITVCFISLQRCLRQSDRVVHCDLSNLKDLNSTLKQLSC